MAAVLVASMRFHFLAEPLDLRYRGPNRIRCRAAFNRGDELGYFEHGSTMLVFGSAEFDVVPSLQSGEITRMGRPLLARVN